MNDATELAGCVPCRGGMKPVRRGRPQAWHFRVVLLEVGLRVGVACLVLLGVITMAGCTEAGATVAGGNAVRGKRLLYAYDCGSCHVIPGVAEANGTLGPPLGGIGSRYYVAGLLENTPENLKRWIREPQQVEPGGAMPNLGVTVEQAGDMAAYLYTLR